MDFRNLFRFAVAYLVAIAALCIAVWGVRQIYAGDMATASLWLSLPAGLVASMIARPTLKRPLLTAFLFAAIGWLLGSPLFALAEQIAYPQDYSVLLAASYYLGWIVIIPTGWLGALAGWWAQKRLCGG